VYTVRGVKKRIEIPKMAFLKLYLRLKGILGRNSLKLLSSDLIKGKCFKAPDMVDAESHPRKKSRRRIGALCRSFKLFLSLMIPHFLPMTS